MQNETYQKCFQDFEILPKLSETHVFRLPFATGTISLKVSAKAFAIDLSRQNTLRSIKTMVLTSRKRND